MKPHPDLGRLIRDMRPNRLVEIVERRRHLFARPGLIGELSTLGDDLTKFHIVGLIEHSGFRLFQRELESRHFNPQDYRVSQQFEYRIVKWFGDVFGVISIPFRKRSYCQEIAKKANIRLQEGLPAVGGKLFPLRNPRQAVCCTDVPGDGDLPDRGFRIFKLEEP